MKKLALIGAFDRDNYGDILFPVIIEEWIKRKQNDFIFDYYGLLESDLSNLGGKATRSIEYFYNHNNYNAIIIVGGQVLNARWSSMHLNLINSSILLKIFNIFYMILGPQKSNEFARKKLKGKTLFPWIISKKNSPNAKIIYNAVGGTSFNNYKRAEFKQLELDLKTADYISVRDSLTRENLVKIGLDKITVSPDSAIIMSQLFDVKVLEEKISSSIKKLINKYGNNKYLCFQIGRSYSINNEQIIAKELINAAKKFDMKIVLLPIGKAAGHEDQIALAKIYKNIVNKVEVEMVKDRGIYDIMYLISQSSIFLGTSLHGCITALSYGVPCIALDKRVVKTEAFLKEFSIDEQLYSVSYDKIVKSIEYTLNISRKKILQNTERLIALVNQNFETIYEILME